MSEEGGHDANRQQSPTKPCGGVVPKGMTQSEFNSWVIGGQYTKAVAKKGSSRQTKEELSEAHRAQIQARKEQLKEELDTHSIQYKPKVASAMRVRSGRGTDNGENGESQGSESKERRESPKKRVPSPPQAAENNDPQSDENTSCALRGRLKVSFAQITATHAYGTLFPPLLTPYNRPCLLGQPITQKQPPPENQIPDMLKSQPQRHAVGNDLSVVAGERRRVQPNSGPKAFFPTGSNTSAYRFFTHIPSSERGTFGVSSR